MNKTTYIITKPEGLQSALDRLSTMAKPMLDGGPIELTLAHYEDKRTSNQNRLFWSIMSDLSEQTPVTIDGRKCKATKEDWAAIMTAGLNKHQRLAEGIDGGIVYLSMRTSKMRVREMQDLIQLAFHFGAERGIKWSDTSLALHGAEL